MDKTVETSEAIRTTSDKIEELSDTLLNLMTQGSAALARKDALEALIASESLMKKTSEGTKYFMAMDFQLTTNIDHKNFDIKKLRDEFIGLMIIEFAKNIDDFLPASKKDYKLSALETSNDMENLYALAATMHRLNPFQQDLLDGSKELKVISFYDVVTQALSIAPKEKKGLISRDQLTRPQKEALREYDRLVYMLKLRYKILPVIALARMSKIQNGIVQKIKMLFWPWQIDQEMQTEEINYITDIFRYAQDTKNFLNSIGENVELDDKVAKIYQNLDWSDEPIFSSTDSNYKDQAISTLHSEMSTFIPAKVKKEK